MNGDGTLPLRLANAVAQAIGSNDKEKAVGCVAVLLRFQVRSETWVIRPKFSRNRFDVIHLKEAAFLRRIAAIFGKADLNTISLKDHSTTPVLRSRRDAKSHL